MNKKNTKQKIKEFFFNNPTARLRVRQIEREVNVPLPSAIRYAKELEEERILTRQTIGGVTFYVADRTSENFRLEKRLFNIRSLYTSGLIDHLLRIYDNPTIVLFGSFATGEDVEKSDIDLFIQTSIKSPKDIRKFENIFNKEIQIFAYRHIRDIKNKHLVNNIINGVALNGFITLFK